VVVMMLGVIAAITSLAVFGPGSIAATVAFGMLWGSFFGGLPSLIQARLLHSASLRLRDTGSAWLTISFNIAIAAGALLGGLVLDTIGITWLPWMLVGLVGAALVFVLATDRVRLRSAAG
jgi:predicted MFS family arabinose efflux permease